MTVHYMIGELMMCYIQALREPALQELFAKVFSELSEKTAAKAVRQIFGN